MLNRRDILKLGTAALALGGQAALAQQTDNMSNLAHLQGWVDLPEAREWYASHSAKPYFDTYRNLSGTGSNKQVLLWKAYEKTTGQLFAPHFQTIGDCIGHGFTLGAEVLCCTEIVAGEREEWRGKFATEVTYAGSRVEVGKGEIKRGDGSTGAWAAEWLRTYGVVLRKSYGNIDLTYYNGDLAKDWGYYKNGVPAEIEKIAKEHPVKTTAMVQSWESCCDAIANGYPVVVCSNVGFNDKLDRDGFLRRGVQPWFHCMLIWGIDTVSPREGGCIANSWGTNWLSGPQHELGTPRGCFWADADVIDSMLKQGDSYALSGFEGFPSQLIDYFLL